ncbi:MAG: T9SS type A sorting domain-containing protein [Chryseolinea sp.]
MTTLHSTRFRILAMTVALSLVHVAMFAQARLVLNGANVNIAQGAYLVIDNSAANAITRVSGNIISEGENNRIKWNMGTATGTYTIPFGSDNTHYIPVVFTKTAGTGSGYFLFSSYTTGWQNSLQLPTGITNFNGGSGVDKSIYATDRFWQINAQGYTVKPDLSNLILTYLDSEFAAPNASSTEANLSAQRWNSSTSSWIDFAPVATTNTTGNTVTIPSVTNTDLYPWWVVDYIQDRHWVASAASNWNDPMNWSTTAGGTGGAGVPTSIDAVIFNDVKDANFTLDADVTMESLTMEAGYSGTFNQGSHTIIANNGAVLAGGTFSGGSADIIVNGPFALSGTAFTSTSGTLDLKGNFTTSGGTFIHNNGTVKFSGTTGTQNISGTTATDFNNLLVSNTSASPGVSIQSNENLKGILTLASNVVMDADGSSNTSVFKLISTSDSPTQDAAIDVLPSGAQITGNVSVQRYMSIEGANGGRIYRYISSPIQNASVADLQQEISVTGSFTGTSICSGCATSQSMFEYNETVITDSNLNGTTDLNDGYIDFPNAVNTETLSPGKGYALFVRGNIMSSALWDVRGTVTTGNASPVTIPTTFTTSGSPANDGWNLVGNPFPSTIDWNAASGWTKTNVSATIYVRDNGSVSPQFASWNGVTGTNGGSRYIPTGQGFWVNTNAASPVLQVNESVKAPGTQSTFFRESSYSNLARITMVKGSLRDETVVHFRADATDGFDSNADAWKLANSIFNLSTVLANGDKLAINSLPSFNCSKTVRLDISNAAVATYSLEFSEYESFSESIKIMLKDNFTNTTFNARSGASYSFSVTSNAASFGSNRFVLIFESAPVSPDFTLSTSTATLCEGSDAIVSVSAAQNGAMYVALLGNTPVSNPVSGNGGVISIIIPGSNLVSGENTLTIQGTFENCSSGIQKTIAVNKQNGPVVTSVDQGKSCGEGAVTVAAHGATDNSHYNWYESVSDALPIVNESDSILITPSISKSKTYYVSVVNESGCEGLRVPVLAEVMQVAAAQISEDGNSLMSNYTAGNQWYFDNSMIEGATKQLITVENPGLYRVKVDVNGCTTSAEYQLVVTGVEKSNDMNVSVYPNPVVEVVNIEIPASLKAVKSLRIMTMTGKTMDVITLDKVSGDRVYKVDMKNYPSGVYIIQAVGSTNVIEIKFVKQ